MAEMQGFKARVEYEVTDGTQLLYTFPFSYLRKKFIKVDVLHDDSSITSLNYGVDYVVNDLSLTLTNPAKVGEHLIIYRQTTTDKIITWNDGSILLARDMNTEDVQMLHLQEEQQDYIQAHSINTKTDSDTKEVLWDALNHRVVNVNDPKDPQDAVTKHYMENVQGGFVAANTILVQEATKQASAAKASQEDAKTSETNAHTSEINSEISHQKAKEWAEATESPDGEADMDSTTGRTQSSRSWALYSKAKAQEATTSATNAKTSETNARSSETNAKTSETKAATSEANAKTSEINAKSSETKSKASENAARVSEQNAAESARVATENAMDFNMLKRNKEYAIGDIAYSSYLPSWARLECVTAGTTADTVPSSITTVSNGGVLISDGTVTWIVDDIRDMTPVGCVRGSLFLPKGYIKANGATVQRADYPRLVQFIDSNNLWTDDTANNAGLFGKGDGNSTFVLPDYRERMIQYADGSIGAKRNAGLPDILGDFSFADNVGRNDNSQAAGDASGSMYKSSITHNVVSLNGGTFTVNVVTVPDKIGFMASRWNSIYGGSTTVQPPAINIIPIIRY